MLCYSTPRAAPRRRPHVHDSPSHCRDEPVAALIDVALFERLRTLDEEFEQLSGALAKAFAGMRPAESSALVGEAVEAARRKRK